MVTLNPVGGGGGGGRGVGCRLWVLCVWWGMERGEGGGGGGAWFGYNTCGGHYEIADSHNVTSCAVGF